MVKEQNQIPKTETVYELKDEYKILSFKEFMKNYENDGNLNYDDLASGDIGTQKGYGPCCGHSTCPCYERFDLTIECHNFANGGFIKYNTKPLKAQMIVSELLGSNYNETVDSGHEISNSVRKKCAELIREAIGKWERGQKINGYVMSKGQFWSSDPVWSYKY